jgi:hypothetical protein
VRLYLTGGTWSADTVDFVRQSVATARAILGGHGIGCRVVPDVGGPLTVLNDARNMAITTRLPDGRHDPQRTDSSGALAVRNLVERVGSGQRGGRITNEVVVIFGPIDQVLRGHTVETGQSPTLQYPFWFVTVNRRIRVKTTMLHEILHCANAQHYMSTSQFGGFGSADIMADQLTDAEAERRSQIGATTLHKLRSAYFYS